MKKVTPFLLFDGQAEEAARFYVSLLPDSQIDRVTRWPADTPSGPAGAVLTVEFTLGGTRFVALNGPEFPFTEAVSFQIACARPGRSGPALGGAVGRRLGRPMRLAQGPLGGVLAGDADPLARADRRPRPEPRPPRNGGDDEDEQDQYRRGGTCRRCRIGYLETPNDHALQRTALAVTAPASDLRLSPTMQGPRQPPPLSLQSLGARCRC